MEEQERKIIEEHLRIEKRFKSGANWFFWVAGLSIINSIIMHSGGQWGFIIGLGLTQFIDGIGLELAREAGNLGIVITLILDGLAAGIFIAFGAFARKGYNWAFIIGMILYALDGMIFLLAKDYIGAGFHLFALFFMYGGFKANKSLKTAESNKSI